MKASDDLISAQRDREMTFGAMVCAEGSYPMSGETCRRYDPVLTLDAVDCTIAPGI